MDLNCDVTTVAHEELYVLQRELHAKLDEVVVELQARAEKEAEDLAEAKVMEKVWVDVPALKPAFGVSPVDPPVWVQPTGAHDSFPPGAFVLHDGKVWQNTVGKLNSWEPGNDGPVPTWTEIIQPDSDDIPVIDGEPVDEPDGTLERPIPWRVGLALKTGDHIEYQGKIYRLLQDHTAVDHYRPGPGLESIYQPA